MIALRACLALLIGCRFAASSAMQKRQAVRVQGGTVTVLLRLLARWSWVGAVLLEAGAWVAQAVGLAIAPVALVVPLAALGTVLLAALGAAWLGERYRPSEILGVALVAVGAVITAVAAAGITPSRHPLTVLQQLALAGVAVVLAGILLRARSGIAFGLAAGSLYAAATVYTKEIGDRLASLGLQGVVVLAESPSPWLLVGLSIGALALVQRAFQRVNAASAITALSAVETLGPIVVSFTLYRERFPHGVDAVVLSLGLVTVLAGLSVFAPVHRRGRTQQAGSGSVPTAEIAAMNASRHSPPLT